MPGAVAEPIRAIIQHISELGWSYDAVLAGSYKVNFRTLQKMRRSWKGFGTVFNPTENVGGHSNFWTGGSDSYSENLGSSGVRCYGEGDVHVATIWVIPLLHCEH